MYSQCYGELWWFLYTKWYGLVWWRILWNSYCLEHQIKTRKRKSEGEKNVAVMAESIPL